MKTIDPIFQHQGAYTHGLEAIYTLEEVDIKTIRTIVAPKEAPKESVAKEPPPLELALGPRYQEEIFPFSFTHWLKEMLAKGDPIKIKALLSAYDIDASFKLDQRQEFEWRRSTCERRAIWAEEAAAWARQNIKPNLAKLVDTYIIPWMWARSGVASRIEIMERLYSMTTEPESADKVIAFIDDLFFDQSFSIGKSLCFVEKNVFAVTESVAKEAHDAIDLALTYFYRPALLYTLDELMQWMKREIAPKWKSFPDGFLERTLRFSSQFQVFKGEKGKLMIRRQAAHSLQGASSGVGL